MSETYHKLPQSSRIQKRLALNHLFKLVESEIPTSVTRLGYITFGGAELGDLLDMALVFDVTAYEISCVTYEKEKKQARAAAASPVAKTLNRIETVSVRVVRGDINSSFSHIKDVRPRALCIYFLDYTKVVTDADVDVVTHLVDENLLREGDYLLVTSSLTPRVTRQQTRLQRNRDLLQEHLGRSSFDEDFVERNFVDLHVSRSFRRTYQKSTRCDCVKKIRYRDTSAMGTWLFRVTGGTQPWTWPDMDFFDFPRNFSYAPTRSNFNVFGGLFRQQKKK